jgi:hypothetical protein
LLASGTSMMTSPKSSLATFIRSASTSHDGLRARTRNIQNHLILRQQSIAIWRRIRAASGFPSKSGIFLMSDRRLSMSVK